MIQVEMHAPCNVYHTGRIKQTGPHFLNNEASPISHEENEIISHIYLKLLPDFLQSVNKKVSIITKYQKKFLYRGP
jgi:hypothetical protein